MSDSESKPPVKGEAGEGGAEHISLKVKGQVQLPHPHDLAMLSFCVTAGLPVRGSRRSGPLSDGIS
jgi:hypothetical protein